jgi:hypothetical protein
MNIGRGWRAAVGGVCALTASLALPLVLAPAAAADPYTYTYNGYAQSYSVPLGVTAVDVTVNGGGGADGTGIGGPGPGASGGMVSGTIPVSPGEDLSVFPGSGGSGQSPGQGLYSGGSGGNNGGLQSGNGGGGGAASTVMLDGRLVMVAGGGGGGGGSLNEASWLAYGTAGEPGGAGGNPPQVGVNSYAGNFCGGPVVGGQTDQSSMDGGNGGDAVTSSTSGGGGGGGGGYDGSGNGGGGGGGQGGYWNCWDAYQDGAGGAGGNSWADGIVENAQYGFANTSSGGNGSVTISPVAGGNTSGEYLVISPGNPTTTWPTNSEAFTAIAYSSSGAYLGDVTSSTTFSINGANASGCPQDTCYVFGWGPETITANDNGITGTDTWMVEPLSSPSITWSTSQATPVTTGDSVTYTATFEPLQQGGGQASFSLDGQTISACASVNLTGTDNSNDDQYTASCTLTISNPGRHTIAVSYPGSSEDGPASSSMGETVDGPLAYLTVVPPATTTQVGGGSQQYYVEGFDSAGDSLGDVTSQASFGVTDGSCAGTICTVSDPGDHTVTANVNGVTATASLTVPATAPQSPTNVWATPGDSSAVVQFSAPSSDGGSPITGYTVTAADETNPENGGQTATGSGSPITVGGLTNGDTYMFTVTADNSVGGSSASSSNLVVPLTVPGPPAVTSVTPGDSQVAVAFSAPPSDGGSTITGYSVTAADQTNPGSGGQTATGSGSPITVGGLTNGDTYSFTVTATNAAGTGQPSPSSSPVVPFTSPGAPTVTGLTPGKGQVEVDFLPGDTGGSPVTAYSVTASDQTNRANGGQTATGSGSPITVGGLTDGDTYTFTVTAINAAGSGTASQPSGPAIPQDVPSAPSITAVTAGAESAAVSFDPPATDNGSQVLSYTVTASDQTNPANGGQTAIGSGSPVTVGGLTDGDTYTFTVAATNGIGTGPSSQPSETAVPSTTPSAPTVTSVTPGDGEVTINFSPASDGGSAITGYTVAATDQTNGANGGQSVTGSASPVTVGGLTDGDAYTFEVRALNANGPGAWSQWTQAVTPAGVPGQPGITSVSAGNGQATVNFSAPSDQGSPITAYTVTASDQTNPSNGDQSATGSGSPITVSGLTDGDAYTFTVTATNGVGTGSPSSPSGPVTPVDPSPVVTGISPDNGPVAGGQTVTISGTALGSATAVSFGRLVVTSGFTDSGTAIEVTVPGRRKAAVVPVTVTTPGGTSATSTATRYTYWSPAAPAVTGLSTALGPVAGGQHITVYGTGFVDVTAVSFGGVAASFKAVTPTELRAVVPPGAAGPVDVTVTAAGGTSPVTSADQYVYGRPSVTQVNPGAGGTAGGQVVTIYGANLGYAKAVKFGGVAGTGLTVVSPSQVTVTAPAHAAGIVDVVVVGKTGNSPLAKSARYRYVNAPTVAGLTPASGPLSGGKTVTITGSGFAGVTSVSFGGLPAATVTPVSLTRLRAVVPAWTGAPPAAAVDVVVTAAGGSSDPSNSSQYTYEPAPTITSLTSNSGPAAGGQVVTVTGTNLATVSAAYFGDVRVPSTAITVVSPGDLAIAVPAHPAGTVRVRVVGPGGTSTATPTDRYTYS